VPNTGSLALNMTAHCLSSWARFCAHLAIAWEMSGLALGAPKIFRIGKFLVLMEASSLRLKHMLGSACRGQLN